MYLLAWIVIGAVVGWGAGRVFQGNGYGPLTDTLMGIGGAIVGGFTMSFAGLGGYGGTSITTLVAMVGAVLLPVLAAYVNGRRIFTRPHGGPHASSRAEAFNLLDAGQSQRPCQPVCAHSSA